MEKDILFMKEAIALAKRAVEQGNEPFGAVLVKEGEIVYTNENQIFSQSDPTFHAEAGLIRRFCQEKQIMDLSEYALYSSCESCFMCSGAIVWSRLGRLVYAASNLDLGEILNAQGSKCSQLVFEHSPFRPTVIAGVLREEAYQVLDAYFGSTSL